MAWQKITKIQPENNELKECHMSGLQIKIRPFANCPNKKECQNRGDSAKHNGEHELSNSS